MALGIQKQIPSAVSTHPRLLPARPLPEQVQLGTEVGGGLGRPPLPQRRGSEQHWHLGRVRPWGYRET